MQGISLKASAVLPSIRRCWYLAIGLLLFLLPLAAVTSNNFGLLSGNSSLISPSTDINDFLTALVSLSATTTAIITAVAFITAQTTARPQNSRAVSMLYQNATTLLTLILFCLLTVIGIIIQSRTVFLPEIPVSPKIIDAYVASVLLGFLLIPPIVLEQIENLNPYYVGLKLLKLINPKTVQHYGLVSVSVSPESKVMVTLNKWNYNHGLIDPLGAFHEVLISSAVSCKDRILLSKLIHALVWRVSVYSDRPPQSLGDLNFTFAATSIHFNHSPLMALRNQAEVTLHVLHYLVRRASHTKTEWGNEDGIRRIFTNAVANLAIATAPARNNQDILKLLIAAFTHISASYAETDVFTENDSSYRWFDVCEVFLLNGKKEEAVLCAECLAFITIRTKQNKLGFNHAEKLPQVARIAFLDAALNADLNKNWVPLPEVFDPWSYRWGQYKLKLAPFEISDH